MEMKGDESGDTLIVIGEYRALETFRREAGTDDDVMIHKAVRQAESGGG